MGKFSKYIYIALGVAGGLFRYKTLFKKKEQEGASGTPSIANNSNTSNTPVSGTSETILNNLGEQEANELKEELK